MAEVRLHLHRSWDEPAWQTLDMCPDDAHAVLLSWSVDPAPVDAGVPPAVAELVAQACARRGPVAFRLFFPHGLSEDATVVRAPWRFLPARLFERLTRRWRADIAIVRTAADAVELFGQDWELQGQTALVLDEGAGWDQAVGLLGRVRDWRGHDFPTAALLLVAPAVDGDGILLAAATPGALEHVVGELAQACGKAGVAFGESPLEPPPMTVEVSHHVDASEPDSEGRYEYYYEYDVYEFSDGATSFVARAYAHERDASFMTCRDAGAPEGRALVARDLRHPLCRQAAAHLRKAGKSPLSWFDGKAGRYLELG